MNDWGTLFQRALDSLVEQSASLLPRMFFSLILVTAGLLLAFLLQALVRVVVRRAGLDRLADRSGIGRTLIRLGYEDPLSHLAGFVTFWTVLAIFLLSGADALRLPAVSQTIARFIAFMPSIALIVLVLLVGFTIARTVRRTIEGVADRSRLISGKALGVAAYYLVLAPTIVIALTGLGVDFTIVIAVLTVVLASIGVGLAVTLATGARRVARNTISGVYARKDIRLGDRIRVGDLEGEVVAVGQIYLTLKNDSRSWLVPYDHLLGSIVEIRERAAPGQ